MGFSRSGKSTWSRKQGFPIVEPDAIRLELYNQIFWGPGERMVWTVVDLMIRSLFRGGNETVILDATNIQRWQRDQWQSDIWETVFHYVDTGADVCTVRAYRNDRSDLVEVIEKMEKQFEPLETDELRYVELMGQQGPSEERKKQ